jgi:hypothetical protein
MSDTETLCKSLFLFQASDIIHDESIGHPVDLVLVRVMYLEKKEEEVRLMMESSRFDIV